MIFTSKTSLLLISIIAIKLLSGCFTFQAVSPNDKINKKQLKKLPESKIVFEANYHGTQTGTRVYFRKDSLFSIQTNSAFGWKVFIGNYQRIGTSDTFKLNYLNEHKAKWNYVILDTEKAFLKAELKDSLPKQFRTFQVLKNEMTN